MARKSDKGGDKGKGRLGLEDFKLWKAFTQDIAPLVEPDWDNIEPVAERLPVKSEAGNVYQPQNASPFVPPSKPKPDQNPQLDARTDNKLRKGKMPIEGRLDLHGHTQDQAHRMLNDFVLRAHADGKRCILVITGKGRGGLLAKDWFSPNREDGILKQKLPQWIAMHPLRDLVLKATTAAPKDGGGGAWYLYLKRDRTYAE